MYLYVFARKGALNMRESKKQKAERIRAALAALKEAYPDAKPELNFTSPFELLVATMLSAQCTDKQVNKATAVLFPLYNTPEAFASLSEEELAPYIRSCGFYQTKGKNIIAASKIIVEQYGGQVRIGLADAKDVLNTEKQLIQNIPEEDWSAAHHWIIFHGRRVCSARSPKCGICTIRPYCLEYINNQKKTEKNDAVR